MPIISLACEELAKCRSNHLITKLDWNDTCQTTGTCTKRS